MASLEQIYAPGEVKTLLEPGEQVRYSLTFTQGKRHWTGLNYEIVHGVWYFAHLTNRRLILESNVTSGQGFFLQKALIAGLSLAARAYGVRHVTQAGGDIVDQLRDSEKVANAVRDQTLSIPYASLARAEKSSAWVRLVLSNPPAGFDPHSLVFMAAPLRGRTTFRTGWATAADAAELINRVLRECPSDAVIVS
jgi:hypothetical protein